ncbi:MAG: hypothetical protein AAF702_22155 [Chloroflexota bacterium]
MLYPEHKPVPDKLYANEFLLRPICASDVNLDYIAVMETKIMLRRLFQSDWPPDDFTVDDNLWDLNIHVKEHNERRQFCYTMMNLSESTCLGAVYVRPLRIPPPEWTIRRGDFPPPVEGEAAIDFWVIPPGVIDDLDRRLVDTLLDWFDQDWDFPRVSYRTNEGLPRQIEVLRESGLRERYVIKRPNGLPNRILYSQ